MAPKTLTSALESTNSPIPSPAEVSTPPPSNQETVVSTTQTTTTATVEGFVADGEKEADDDSCNPAMSMSASQLLRLKRMNDEPPANRVGSDSQSHLNQRARNQVTTLQLTNSSTPNHVRCVSLYYLMELSNYVVHFL